MKQTDVNGVCDLDACRKPADFRRVPKDTEELNVSILRSAELTELSLLGQRLKSLSKLTLTYGDVERLDFLQSFHSIRILTCHLANLKDFTGIGHCVKLTDLRLGGSLSSVGDLSFLRHLSQLERLWLEGPHPSKRLDEIEPMRTVKRLDLYAPKWSLEHLPRVFPAVEDLSISQGGYRCLNFILSLDKLTALDIAYAKKLTAFDAIGRHPRLRTLRIGHAITSLQSCSQFGCSSTVEQIKISGCKQLKDIGALVDWPAIREVRIYDCPLIPVAQIETLRKIGKTVNGK